MDKQSHEMAAESRANEAAILGGRSRRAVICGREYTFLQPSRRDNRLMFGDVVRIQQLGLKPENRARVLMEMFNFLIDWFPAIAADEVKIDDTLNAEMSQGNSTTAMEIITAWQEVALLVSRPFQNTALTEKTETGT